MIARMKQDRKMTRNKNPAPAHIRSIGHERMELLKQAARLYNDFTGHGEFTVEKVKVKNFPRELVAIGECVGIMYDTVRDGQYEKYVHRFRKGSRPLLTVSPDGKQLMLIGGSYVFTERGIVDK